MAFRGRRVDWDEFLEKFGTELRLCGIPDYVIQNKMRFLVFLDHGFDERGWAENHHSFFDSRILSDEQIKRLAEIVGTHIDERYRIPISSRWQRLG